uniref:flagellin n=1 Tax=Pseudorhizobium marinum TaxID=1496690 RepID=UPI0038B4E29C
MLKKTISAASRLGALQGRIDMQTEFVSKLSANIDKGVGRLVDADMNEESTRLKALQTQEQLAIQSLSIANTGADVIMQLFR